MQAWIIDNYFLLLCRQKKKISIEILELLFFWLFLQGKFKTLIICSAFCFCPSLFHPNFLHIFNLGQGKKHEHSVANSCPQKPPPSFCRSFGRGGGGRRAGWGFFNFDMNKRILTYTKSILRKKIIIKVGWLDSSKKQNETNKGQTCRIGFRLVGSHRYTYRRML